MAKAERATGPHSLHMAGIREEFRRDLRAKIRAAANAWPLIRDLSFEKRVALCGRLAEFLEQERADFEELLVTEAGNPRKFARWESSRAPQMARDFPQVLEEIRPRSLPARKGTNVLYHEPYGVVAVMSPANAPMIVPLYNLLSALGAGNAVVLRPSSHAPAVAQRLVDLFDRAGLLRALSSSPRAPRRTPPGSSWRTRSCGSSSPTRGAPSARTT